ncbi:AAA family ATPase [Kitasatospora sp. NPDC048365]|uniref:AAA family ATPase n=1 Tax=Kitasatospora sp. NPDC048365 TaxID=3364050 RepID=UPI00371192DA
MPSIVSFEIAGLAGRDGIVRHQMQPDVNVFWGLNGSGKTSLLKILHSALLGEASLLVRVPFDWAFVKIGVNGKIIERRIQNPKARKNLEIEPAEGLFDELEWRDRRAGEELVDRAGKMHWSTKPASLDGRSFRHSYLSVLRFTDSPRFRPGSSDILDDVAYDRMFARQIQHIWQDYYTRELMQIRQTQQNGLAAIAKSVVGKPKRASTGKSTVSDVDVDTAYIAVKNFFQDQNLELDFGSFDQFSESFTSNALMREVVGEIVEVQNGVESAQEPKRALQELIQELFRGRKQINFEGRFLKILNGPDEIPLESLSSGEKQVVRLLVECLAAGSNSVLIDEPEISMHVDWQHRLVNCMRTVNPQAQLILATHSPEVMAELPDRTIIEL